MYTEIWELGRFAQREDSVHIWHVEDLDLISNTMFPLSTYNYGQQSNKIKNANVYDEKTSEMSLYGLTFSHLSYEKN